MLTNNQPGHQPAVRLAGLRSLPHTPPQSTSSRSTSPLSARAANLRAPHLRASHLKACPPQGAHLRASHRRAFIPRAFHPEPPHPRAFHLRAPHPPSIGTAQAEHIERLNPPVHQLLARLCLRSGAIARLVRVARLFLVTRHGHVLGADRDDPVRTERGIAEEIEFRDCAGPDLKLGCGGRGGAAVLRRKSHQEAAVIRRAHAGPVDAAPGGVVEHKEACLRSAPGFGGVWGGRGWEGRARGEGGQGGGDK
mmetsp:Transcript_19495/g.57787  ORF Transcript_19495/g.57787 Transcript_19495/m.57787 type:complete len:251 (+) Transcript_19495:724-1476(+)